jgi:exosortase K
VLSTLKQVRQPLIWWLLAVGTAAALKWHFSAADSSALGWMLRPLAMALQKLAGWHFQRTSAGEWRSAAAGIVLVKACAGINFMTMSFIGWCALARPQGTSVRLRAMLSEWPQLLAGALVLAWCTALYVNALRVMAVVAWQPTLQQWLTPAAAHRLIGLLIYLPALTLQFMQGVPRRGGRAAVAGAAIYVVVMLVVPLLTGNAGANLGLYREHALMVLAIVLPMVAAGVLFGRMRIH